MGSVNIEMMRNEFPGKPDAEAAKALAEKYGYVAVVRYRNSQKASDFTNIGVCKTGDEIRSYFESSHCYSTELIYPREGVHTGGFEVYTIPNRARDLNDEGAEHIRMDDLEKAEACFREGASINPQNEFERSAVALAHGNLGHVYGLRKQFQEAIPLLEKALELDPNIEGVPEALADYKKRVAPRQKKWWHRR